MLDHVQGVRDVPLCEKGMTVYTRSSEFRSSIGPFGFFGFVTGAFAIFCLVFFHGGAKWIGLPFGIFSVLCTAFCFVLARWAREAKQEEDADRNTVISLLQFTPEEIEDEPDPQRREVMSILSEGLSR